MLESEGNHGMQSVDLDIVVLPGVYPPSEDTFLLCDSIELRPEDTFLEVGSGTGFIALTASCITIHTVAIDISFQAVLNTYLNSKRNNLTHCAVIQSDLMSAIRPDVKFSVIAFNPPYLPADETATTLDHALIGGKSGVEVVNRFLVEAREHLIENGQVYVVVSSATPVDRVIKRMRNCSMYPEVVAQTSFFFEHIYVLRGIYGTQANHFKRNTERPHDIR